MGTYRYAGTQKRVVSDRPKNVGYFLVYSRYCGYIIWIQSNLYLGSWVPPVLFRHLFATQDKPKGCGASFYFITSIVKVNRLARLWKGKPGRGL